MRYHCFFLLHCLGLCTALAQMSFNRPIFHAGDTLTLVQIAPPPIGESGDSCLWDFSSIQDSLFHTSACYLTKTDDSTQIGVHRLATRYYYHQTADSLYATGYETATTHMHYIEPELLMAYPFDYGDTLFSSFVGQGEYCRMLPVCVKGSTQVKADARGTLVLPDITIPNTLRIHTIREIQKPNPDNAHITMHIYQWFSPTVSYPLLETMQIQTFGRLDTTLQELAFYFPLDESLVSIFEQIDTLRSNSLPIDTIFTNARFLPNPVQNELHISYYLTRAARIAFSLHSNVGIPLYTSAVEQQDEGDHKYTIDMSPYMTGTYILYIRVDDIMRSETIIKL